MKYRIFHSILTLSLLPAIVIAQTGGQRTRRDIPRVKTTKPTNEQTDTIKICQGIPVPANYVIVAIEALSACPAGAYVLKRVDSTSQMSTALTVAAQRPRTVNQHGVNLEFAGVPVTSNLTVPALKATEVTSLEPPAKDLSPTSLEKPIGEELNAGDVVRIETNLVTVPVSVMDRQGRYIPNLRPDQFKVFDNDVEQPIVHFEPTDKPFTVALMLDTSGSTVFHLSEIKEAAIAFAKQLRPQDRVLIVAFDRLVMLLTEATGDLKVVTSVIDRNVVTGFSTRLYDAIDLVITQRLNNIPGRKAIVLFTYGVDTASYDASYKSTLREVDEQDILVYPVQYDTSDFTPVNKTEITTVTARSSSGTSTTTETSPSALLKIPGVFTPDYKLAGEYLQQLATKTGGRIYEANDTRQLGESFSRIAEELRSQYSVGYYPQTQLKSGERRSIKVRVDEPNVAVRARESYTRREH